MVEDPIVEELHKIREEMLVEYGGLEGLVKHLRKVRRKCRSVSSWALPAHKTASVFQRKAPP